jgi:hypothetical protein
MSEDVRMDQLLTPSEGSLEGMARKTDLREGKQGNVLAPLWEIDPPYD